MATPKRGKDTETVLRTLLDEMEGNSRAAAKRLAPQYTMTWMYQDKRGKLFPRVGPGIDAEALSDVYAIKGRRYDIKHIVEGKGVIMVELVESYPALKRKQTYRTPLVLVLEMRNGKIARGRHYCDPRLSYKNLSEVELSRVFR